MNRGIMLKQLNNLAKNLKKQNLNRQASEINILIKKVAKTCYPDDYNPGKEYGRDILAEIFCCIADDDSFSIEIVKEVYFPYLPGKKDVSIDPKRIQVGPDEYIDMEEFVAREKKKTPNGWKMEIVTVSKDMLHPDTLKFIPKKKKSPGYKDRIDYQKDKINKSSTLEITKDEPIIFELIDDKYKLQEGWHRFLAILEMLEDGELSNPKVYAAIAEVK
jgi:hypothetical protein